MEPLSVFVARLLGEGYLGLSVVMFLAGSFAPIPWELVLLPAGAMGLDPLLGGLSAGLGASLGGAVGYLAGRHVGRRLVLGYGGYVMVSEGDLALAEGWLARWGDTATLVTRSIQYMPYKTYSLAAGVLRVEFRRYMAWTVVGSVIRCSYMVYLGGVAALGPGLLAVVAAVALLGLLLAPRPQPGGAGGVT